MAKKSLLLSSCSTLSSVIFICCCVLIMVLLAKKRNSSLQSLLAAKLQQATTTTQTKKGGGGSKSKTTTTTATAVQNVGYTAVDNLSMVGKILGESSWTNDSDCSKACLATTGCAFFEQRKKDKKCVLKDGDFPESCKPFENPAKLCMDTYDTDATSYVYNVEGRVENAKKVAETNYNIKKATDCNTTCEVSKAFEYIGVVLSFVVGNLGSVASLVEFVLNLSVVGVQIGTSVASAKQIGEAAAKAMSRWDSRLDNSAMAYANYDLLGQYDAMCTQKVYAYSGKAAFPVPNKFAARYCTNTDGTCPKNTYRDQVKAKISTPGFFNEKIGVRGIPAGICGWEWAPLVIGSLPMDKDCPMTGYYYYDTWFKKECEKYNCTDDFKKRMRKIAQMTTASAYVDYKNDKYKNYHITDPKRLNRNKLTQACT